MASSSWQRFNGTKPGYWGAYQYIEAAAGAPQDPRRPSCSDSCYSPWCSGLLLAWIALAGAGFMTNGLIELAIIGIVLFLITGALGAMARPSQGLELVLAGICGWR